MTARAYFADTWYFIATIDRFDDHHRRAIAAREATRGAVLVTHDGVLTEVLAYFSRAGVHGRRLAAEGVRDAMRRFDVILVDRPLFLRALTRYEQRPDKEYSLVDCMSMVVMEERGITHVLTNDHHFSQAGFTVVSQ